MTSLGDRLEEIHKKIGAATGPFTLMLVKRKLQREKLVNLANALKECAQLIDELNAEFENFK